MNISRKKTEYLGVINIKTQISFTGRGSTESEDIHIPGIYVGGGWSPGCGINTQSAERVEELEESVWRFVRREKNEKIKENVYVTVV